MKRTLIIMLALTLGLFAYACSKTEDKEARKALPPDTVLVKVNGEPITEAMVQRALKTIAGQHSGETTAMREAMVENLIAEMLLLQSAREADSEVSPQEAVLKVSFIREQMGADGFAQKLASLGLNEDEYTQDVGDNMLRQRYLDSLMNPNVFSEEAAKRKFGESTTPYLTTAQTHVRFIQADTFEQANKIMERVRAGDFDKVADELADSGDAIVSGYGWTSVSMYGKELSEGLLALGKGEVGGPYKGRQGYFLFRVKDRKTERPQSFDEVKGQIMSELRDTERSKVMAHWLAEKRAAATLEWR